MKKIYLIRHGETTGDLEDRYGGQYDDHLSEAGLQQAQALSDQLKGKNIEKIFHSPMIRATETADIVSRSMDIPMQTVEDLRERNSYGILTGMIKAKAKEKYPEEATKIELDKVYHDVTDSEEYNSFAQRVLGVFEEVIFSSHVETIAIITHGSVIGSYAREYLRLGEFKRLGDCAIIELDHRDGQVYFVNLHNAELE